jgi:excisionase family DNA binding protein
MFTVKALAERLACSPATVYSLIAGGKLSCYRIGTTGRGAIRVSDEQLAEFLGNAEPKANPPAPRVRLKHLRF